MEWCPTQRGISKSDVRISAVPLKGYRNRKFRIAPTVAAFQGSFTPHLGKGCRTPLEPKIKKGNAVLQIILEDKFWFFEENQTNFISEMQSQELKRIRFIAITVGGAKRREYRRIWGKRSSNYGEFCHLEEILGKSHRNTDGFCMIATCIRDQYILVSYAMNFLYQNADCVFYWAVSHMTYRYNLNCQ